MQKIIFFLLSLTTMLPIIAMDQRQKDFFAAIKDGNVDEVKKLITAGIDIDKQDDDGNTPIIVAVTTEPLNNGIIDAILNEIPNTILANKNNKNAESIAKGDLLQKIIPIRNQYLLYEQMALKPLNISDIKRTLVNTTTKGFINSPNQNRNLLANAIRKANEYVVGEIISKGADVNQVFRDGTTPLDIANTRGDANIIKLLISKGAQSSAQQFFEAVIAGSNVEDIAEFIKNRGLSVDAKDKNGNTALMLALEKDNTALMNKLLELGANITIQNKDGNSALESAIILVTTVVSNVDLVKTLLSKSKKLEIDAPVNKDGSTALTYAIEQNVDENIIKAILEQVPDPSKAIIDVQKRKESKFRTRMLNLLAKAQAQYDLYKGISEGSWSRALITDAVTLQVPNEDRNPLAIAIKNGNLGLVKTLIAKKPDKTGINLILRNGKTPLIMALEVDHVNSKIVKFLVKSGADPKLAGADGKTPLAIAQEKGITEIVELLEKAITERAAASEVPVTTSPVDDKPLLSSLHNFMQSLGALQNILTSK